MGEGMKCMARVTHCWKQYRSPSSEMCSLPSRRAQAADLSRALIRRPIGVRHLVKFRYRFAFVVCSPVRRLQGLFELGDLAQPSAGLFTQYS